MKWILFCKWYFLFIVLQSRFGAVTRNLNILFKEGLHRRAGYWEHIFKLFTPLVCQLLFTRDIEQKQRDDESNMVSV